MEDSSPPLLARVVLGVVVGFGFVTPTVAAAAVFVGANVSLSILAGVVVGAGVTALVITRMDRVRRGL